MSPMVVAVGTKNKTKIAAVRETLKSYSKFKDVEILEFSVDLAIGFVRYLLHRILTGILNGLTWE